MGLFSNVPFFEFEGLELVDVWGGGAGAFFLGLAFVTFLIFTDDEGLDEGLEVDVLAVGCFLGDFEALEEEFSLG